MTGRSRTHKHHIIPKHAGGDNSPENLIELTIEEHAEAHRILYVEHGRWQDKVAWKLLLGQIDIQEMREIMMKEHNPMFDKEIVKRLVENRRNGDGYMNTTFKTNNPMKNPEIVSKLSGDNHWSKRHGKIHNAKTNHPKGASKKIKVYDIEYDSILAASKALNIGVKKIRKIGELL